MTVAEAQAAGLNLSEREIAAVGGPDAQLGWNQGFIANILNPDAQFISGARDASMPLAAGISGTTHRFGQIADMLGSTPRSRAGRHAAADSDRGQHTFHEIASAAQGSSPPAPAMTHRPPIPRVAWGSRSTCSSGSPIRSACRSSSSTT